MTVPENRVVNQVTADSRCCRSRRDDGAPARTRSSHPCRRIGVRTATACLLCAHGTERVAACTRLAGLAGGSRHGRHDAHDTRLSPGSGRPSRRRHSKWARGRGRFGASRAAFLRRMTRRLQADLLGWFAVSGVGINVSATESAPRGPGTFYSYRRDGRRAPRQLRYRNDESLEIGVAANFRGSFWVWGGVRMRLDKLTSKFQMALADAQSLAVGRTTSSSSRRTYGCVAGPAGRQRARAALEVRRNANSAVAARRCVDRLPGRGHRRWVHPPT